MNIRSMIKHVAAIITAVGMLLASMAGAVTALAEDSKPTTAVDGPTKPVRIMDNLYQTRYTGDYKLDDYLSANAGGNDVSAQVPVNGKMVNLLFPASRKVRRRRGSVGANMASAARRMSMPGWGRP